MKATELVEAVSEFESYVLYSDYNSEVRFGCDCGCGGENYTSETWDQMVEEYKYALEKMKKLCKELGVEFDYDFT